MPSATLADDAYHRLSELLPIQRNGQITEAFLTAVTNGIVFRYGDTAVPDQAEPGTIIAAGGSVGLGPVRGEALTWHTVNFWVRNETAGQNATVVLNATFLPEGS